MPRKQKKYHYIYKTTCSVTNKFYVGMHSTDNLEDGYLGSGKRIRYSINKYGKENHIKDILEFLIDRSSLKDREKELVNEEMIQGVFCMNLKEGGEGGLINEKHAKKFHSAGGKKVFQLLNERHCEKLKHDKEYRQKWFDSRKTLVKEKTSFYKCKHSKKTKRKIGRTNSIKQKGERNSQFGTCWITNGQQNKKIQRKDKIPDGWKKGRKYGT